MSDEFSVLTDPNSQKANGFGFGVNVMNAQTEVLLTTGNADATWDNKWSSHVSRYADKWIVEMAIPFKTLRRCMAMIDSSTFSTLAQRF